MKFSIKVQYGLQAMLVLSLNYGGGQVRIKSIASEQKIPIRFLEQLLLVLKRAGLVNSLRGKHGGYLLGRKPSEISLLDVIEALEGPLELTSKKMKKTPIIFETFKKVQSDLHEQLKRMTLAEMTLKARRNDLALTYSI